MAAAYGALVSLLNDLVDIQNHPRHLCSFDSHQIQSLRESVTFLIDFMESYDNCHGSSKEAAQLLEMPITRAARVAEEVIESHLVDQIRAGNAATHSLPDLQEVIEGIDLVRREAMEVQAKRELKLKPQPTNSAAETSSTPPITSEQNSMVGFDEILLELLNLLTGHPPSRVVIPIVGTGGIGKTTLAKYAFEHPLVVETFDVCLWASISQQYVVHDILYKFLSPEGESNGETVGELGLQVHQRLCETVGELGLQVHQRLYGRKYLIVLDDVWSVEPWEEMKFFFPDTSNGSRVVMTTRHSDVAHHLSSSKLGMSFLSDVKSWDLFCEKTFAGKGCPPELEEVGKKIVRKCKGLPLAIVVVAGCLAKASRMKEYWESVSNNMSSALNSEENYQQLLDVLSFSYNHLPVHLKPCFVFMGMLKEDEWISVPEIINRWIAEGYLKPCNAENWEEIAEDYLKDLIDRNLILTDKGFSKVGIHDVLRELCLKIAEKEMFFYVVETPEAIYREREVDTPIVRCLRWPEDEVSLDLRLLRVVYKNDDVNGSYLEANLQQANLRYLQYKRDKLHTSLHISPSISLLWNLQTLIIQQGISTLCVAPYEIWEMLQLRHVDVLHHIRLPSVKSDQGDGLVMQNLRTLKCVINFKITEEVCRRVPNIKDLRVRYNRDYRLEEVRSYCPHNLGSFRKLESLNCRLSSRSSFGREFALSMTLPSSLKKLILWNSYLQWAEMVTMVGSLPHLEILALKGSSVTDSKWNPVEGKFLGLKQLYITGCHELVYWDADSSCFPVLEYVYLYNLSRLKKFPSGIGEIPTLRSIELRECSDSCSVSAVRVVVEQVEDFGNQDLRLRVCISDDEERVSLQRKLRRKGLKTKNVRIVKQ